MRTFADRSLVALYAAALTLLVVHEIDSAYWHEWTLFGLPGGIELFLVVHLVALPPFLYGLVLLARDLRAGAPFALVLSAAGIAAFGIHSTFLLLGAREFRTVASVSVLAATLVVSLLLLVASMAALRRGRDTAAVTPDLAPSGQAQSRRTVT